MLNSRKAIDIAFLFCYNTGRNKTQKRKVGIIMKLIKNILNPVICLAMGYTCVHFYDAGNYDSVILCFVIFVLWMFRYLED